MVCIFRRLSSLNFFCYQLFKSGPFPGVRDIERHLVSNADRLIISDFLIRSIIRNWALLEEKHII